MNVFTGPDEAQLRAYLRVVRDAGRVWFDRDAIWPRLGYAELARRGLVRRAGETGGRVGWEAAE